jgi:hypothetical protein
MGNRRGDFRILELGGPPVCCFARMNIFQYDILSRYRVFAELLEQGMRTTLKIPTHAPVPSLHDAQTPMASRTQLPVEGDPIRVLGVNPGIALQHPGFYYYMAARCTERRRQRFLVAADSEVLFTDITLGEN